ncbi:hypothetical protein HAX54_052443, partial [Datura stramonium]|nr:hypothetical protein [Datura stramonium]
GGLGGCYTLYVYSYALYVKGRKGVKIAFEGRNSKQKLRGLRKLAWHSKGCIIVGLSRVEVLRTTLRQYIWVIVSASFGLVLDADIK